MSTVVVWFRNNLRIHDNEALHRAREFDLVVPLYVFDPHWFGQTSFGFAKTGSYRTGFLIESVQNLRKNLRKLGSDLVVRHGLLEEVLRTVVDATGADMIVTSKEVTAEEVATENKVMNGTTVPVQFVEGRSLFHPEDIPYEPDNIPKVFTNFRKQIEKKSTVRDCYPVPESLSKCL